LRRVEAESLEPQVCDVCGRHMLPGEHTREYLTPQRERRAVCDLCRTKAQRAGWVRADRAPEPSPDEQGDEKPRRRLRFRPRISLVRNPPRGEEGDGGEEAKEGNGGEEAKEGEEGARDRREPSRGDGRRRRRVAAETPERRIRRAIDRFNHSEHRRTVAGLTRSLGSPRVAAITPADSPDQVRLTVAWDLSWYQWEVELSERETAVHSLGTGTEMSELGPADRAWNARAGEDGRLQLRPSGNGDGELPPPDESA
jgi:hypothetical protein